MIRATANEVLEKRVAWADQFEPKAPLLADSNTKVGILRLKKINKIKIELKRVPNNSMESLDCNTEVEELTFGNSGVESPDFWENTVIVAPS